MPYFLVGKREVERHEFGSGRLPSTDSIHLTQYSTDANGYGRREQYKYLGMGRTPVYAPDLRIFNTYSNLTSLGTRWKKVWSFSAHNGPATSRVEENPVRITSIHWLRGYEGIEAPLLVSFLYHGVK